MLIIFLIVLALIWIIIAIFNDLKTREIPNWLNFSLIIFALGARFFYSLFEQNWNFFIYGLLGLGVFFILGNILYYSKFFAGGDAKLFIALGAIIPFSTVFIENLNLFGNFVLLFLISGAIFGIASVLYFSCKNFTSIKKDFANSMKNNKRKFYSFMIAGLAFMIAGFYMEFLFLLGAILFVFPYIFYYTKSIDNTSLVRKIDSKKLTEGDWLYSSLKIGKRAIEPRWEGLNAREIALIRKKYKFVRIRRGIEFSPVFLVSFVVFVYCYFAGIILWNSFW
jgi:Flp pilus assembly protein protease CpaA